MEKFAQDYLRDKREFLLLMTDAGIMLTLGNEKEYDFLNSEESLKIYDENAADFFHWMEEKEVKSPSTKWKVLFLMGMIASQRKNYTRGFDGYYGDNVIDFLSYKEFSSNVNARPLTNGNRLGRKQTINSKYKGDRK